jgi:hypothetical protein
MKLHGLVTRLGVCVQTTIHKAVILSVASHGFIARSEVKDPEGAHTCHNRSNLSAASV